MFTTESYNFSEDVMLSLEHAANIQKIVITYINEKDLATLEHKYDLIVSEDKKFIIINR